MDFQKVLQFVDELVFAKTGRHLDNLQVAILKGVLNNQKYAEIAEEYCCTQGHVRDASYELWQILSGAVGEDLNKSNFRATVERWGVANFSNIGSPVQIGHINFCPNPSQQSEPAYSEQSKSKTQDTESLSNDSYSKEYTSYQKAVEEAKRKAKLEAVPKLAKLGLTPEQIAQSLDLSLTQVHQAIQYPDKSQEG